MDQDEAAGMARAAGLTRLLETNPVELRAALEASAATARRLPQDLAWTEEPAHVFRLPVKSEKRS